VGTAEFVPGGSVPPIAVRALGSEISLPAGRSYLIGRDPACDIVIADSRVSWRHAMLGLEHGRWVLADDGSTNGTYAGDRRVDRIEIDGECLIRLGDPADGPVLSCAVSGADPGQAGGAPPTVWPPSATVLRIGRAADNDVVVPDPCLPVPRRAAPGGGRISHFGPG
jgi:ABC transport system ATP-binding/permease protein